MNTEEEATTDAALLRAADENPDAFCELYDRHVVEIFRWFRARAGDAAAADLAAEVFAQAWLSRRRFRDEQNGSAGPWLYGIARNVLRRSLRKNRLERAARERLGLPVDLWREDGYDEVDERLSVSAAKRGAVAALSPRDRAALELRLVDGHSYRELATRLQCTPVAARLRVSRALRRLRTSI